MRTTGNISATYEYIADVQPDSGAPAFRTTFKEHFSGQFRNANIRRPDVGEQARVTFDPESQKVEFDLAALRAERKTSKQASDASFDSLASSPPGTTTPSASGPNEPRQRRSSGSVDEDANKTIAEARQIWRENLRQGYCTQEEYDQQMRELDEA